MSVRELTLLGAGGDLELNDAGIFLAVTTKVQRAGQPRVQIPPIRVALAWLWESATRPFQIAAAAGQDATLFRARDDVDDPYELADLSGSSRLWERALNGTPDSEQAERRQVGPPAGLDSRVVDEAGDRARGAFVEREWGRITAGVELLLPSVNHVVSQRLRSLMRGGFERGFADLRAASTLDAHS
ncbi:MAG: hypothetical protein AB7S68_06255 [Polyangiaceae bacterium]